ncbi:hypothetical protein SLEP1_g7139 [Rubroshorea leprosula]|uniref:Uncharacterized protein n=1 Tax=Rubroshorea leprosula TaxID=152421 RepID=A0AAV5I889_9ROSI|nr:hypothetical protein SLEP1_g7139 [Rubroshorea leprosula]
MWERAWNLIIVRLPLFFLLLLKIRRKPIYNCKF